MKLTKEKMLYVLLLTNPLLSLLFDGTSVRYYYITLPIIFLILFSKLIKKKAYRRPLLAILSVSAISILTAIVRGGDLGKIHNHLFNYLDCMLLFLYSSLPENRDRFLIYIKKHTNSITLSLILINAVELVLISTHRGYRVNINWGGTFFYGTNSMPHTLAYLMIVTIIYAIIVCILKKQKRYCILCILPLYCIFLTGVRVALLPVGILSLIITDIVFSKRTKTIFVRLLTAIVLAGVFFLIFRERILSSNMMAKIIKRSSSGAVTSGRLDVWVYLFRYFKSSITNWMIGMGDQTVYLLNSRNPMYYSEIWAHSDFVQVLIGKGLPCLMGYTYCLVIYCRSLMEKRKKYYGAMISLMVIVLAAFNGFYSYRDIMLAIPAISIMVYLLNEEWFTVDIKAKKVVSSGFGDSIMGLQHQIGTVAVRQDG